MLKENENITEEITAENIDDFSIEAAFKRLEEINGRLAAPGTTLKDSLALYTEGVELIKKCEENLAGIEKEMKILTAEGEE